MKRQLLDLERRLLDLEGVEEKNEELKRRLLDLERSSAGSFSSARGSSSSEGEDSSRKDSKKEEKPLSASIVAKFWARLNPVKAMFSDGMSVKDKAKLLQKELALGTAQTYCKHLDKAGISLIFTCIKCKTVFRSARGFGRHLCLLEAHRPYLEVPLEYITCSQS